MGDLKINGITPVNIQFGGQDVDKVYNGSELVWPPSSSDPIDPYTPVDGTARLIAAQNAAINLYDTSFNTITPTNPFSSLPNINYEIAGVSDNLTYMVVCGAQGSKENIKISQNGGVSFSDPFTGTFATTWMQTIASKSGQVILSAITPANGGTAPTTNENWMLSTDYGANFAKITFPNVIGVSSVRSASLSSGGKYIALSFTGLSSNFANRNYLFYSVDYGATWFKETIFGASENRRWVVLMSGTGQYMVFIDIYTPSNSFYSSDYGANFSSKNYNFGSSLFTLNGTVGAVMDISGEHYIVARPLANEIDHGDNYAANMPSNSLTVNGSAKNVRISNNGETQLWFDEGSGSPWYGISLDFGATWYNYSAPSSVAGGSLFIADVS